MTKSAKSDVNYSTGMLHSHCGPTFRDDKFYCKHFIPKARSSNGTCDVVEGEIDPTYWCERYQRVKAKSS